MSLIRCAFALSLVTASLAPQAGHAQTSHAQAVFDCPALRDTANAPAELASDLPLYGTAATGWVFSGSHLRWPHRIDDDALGYWRHIADAFARHGTRLSVLVLPPRGVVADGADLPDLATGHNADIPAGAAAFSTAIAQLRESGAIVPDLLQAARTLPSQGREFYFRRDHHWTPDGVVAALNALQVEMAARGVTGTVALDPDDLSATPQPPQIGKQHRIVEQACNTQLPGEEWTRYDAPRPVADIATALLGDAVSAQRAVLVGASNANKFMRDDYNVAGLLAYILDMPVANHAVAGGGMTDALISYLSSDTWRNDPPAHLIWEMSGTTNPSDIDALSQVAAALEGSCTIEEALLTTTLQAPAVDWIEIPLPSGGLPANLIQIEGLDPLETAVPIDLTFADGTARRIRLRDVSRPAQIGDTPFEMRWAALLRATPTITGLRMRATHAASVAVRICRT